MSLTRNLSGGWWVAGARLFSPSQQGCVFFLLLLLLLFLYSIPIVQPMCLVCEHTTEYERVQCTSSHSHRRISSTRAYSKSRISRLRGYDIHLSVSLAVSTAICASNTSFPPDTRILRCTPSLPRLLPTECSAEITFLLHSATRFGLFSSSTTSAIMNTFYK